jgi:hypothetical protein
MISGKKTLIFIICCLFAAQSAWAARPDFANNPNTSPSDLCNQSNSDGDHDEDHNAGRHKKIKKHKKGKRHSETCRPAKRKGLIKTGRHVFYPGEAFSLSVVLPKSLKAFWNGDAEAWLLIQDKNGSFFPIAVSDDDALPDRPKVIIEDIILDPENFPQGCYQIALILTEKDGDPGELSDWYNGFGGLVSISRIILAEPGNTEDTDQDGEVDQDDDGDGYPDTPDTDDE